MVLWVCFQKGATGYYKYTGRKSRSSAFIL